jgi:hypothetical protein
MKIDLKYFSGTGNSWKVLDTCKEVFIENNHAATVSPIKTIDVIVFWSRQI